MVGNGKCKCKKSENGYFCIRRLVFLSFVLSCDNRDINDSLRKRFENQDVLQTL